MKEKEVSSVCRFFAISLIMQDEIIEVMWKVSVAIFVYLVAKMTMLKTGLPNAFAEGMAKIAPAIGKQIMMEAVEFSAFIFIPWAVFIAIRSIYLREKKGTAEGEFLHMAMVLYLKKKHSRPATWREKILGVRKELNAFWENNK